MSGAQAPAPDELPELRENGDRFGELAVALNLIAAGRMLEALREQAAGRNAKRIGDLLAEKRWMDLRSIQKVLLEQQRRRGKAPAPDASGKKFGGYDLLAKLGEGGMGAVYKAREPLSGRLVALKVLNTSLTSDQAFLARFQREARVVGSLNHPNIVGAFASGDEAGVPFLAMEFVDGESAKVRLKRLGRLPEAEALRIVMAVVEGLAHAHAASMIHRDVKPDNILLGADGAVKLADLGLARSMDDDQRLTKTGIAMGTPHYISPEQARGQSEIDGRTDIYSLGATLYVFLTGQVPFQGANNAEIMLKHLKEELENPQDLVPEISDGLVAVLGRMMAKKPSDRYPDCQALLADLRRAATGQPPAAAAASLETTSIRPARMRKPRRAGAVRSGGGCLVTLACGAGLAATLTAAALLAR